MTAADAFEKWWSQRNPGLPWECDKSAMAEAFGAGWGAHETLASVAQLAEQAVCSGQVAGSTPAASSKHEGKWVDGPGEITPETIYAAYPRKVGRQDALKAIQKAVKGCRGMKVSTSDYRLMESFFPPGAVVGPLGFLLCKTKAYAAAVAQWPESEKQYIPHPATWFNRGSYEDDEKEWRRGTATTSQFRTHH